MVTIELRLYRRFDADLLALVGAGVPLVELARRAVTAYARGETLKFIPDRCGAYDPTDKENCHLRVRIQDPQAERLLRQVRHGYKCQFVKTIIRQALIEQSLGPFFTQPDAFEAERARIGDLLKNREAIGQAVGGTAEVLGYRKKRRSRKTEILKAPEDAPAGMRKRNESSARTGAAADTAGPDRESPKPVSRNERQTPDGWGGRRERTASRDNQERQNGSAAADWNDGFAFAPKRFRPDVGTEKDTADTGHTENAADTGNINREFLNMFDNM